MGLVSMDQVLLVQALLVVKRKQPPKLPLLVPLPLLNCPLAVFAPMMPIASPTTVNAEARMAARANNHATTQSL